MSALDGASMSNVVNIYIVNKVLFSNIPKYKYDINMTCISNHYVWWKIERIFLYTYIFIHVEPL